MPRLLYLILGHLFVAIGLIGLVLPLLPTTPFLILASACYMRSSERLRRALMEHKWLGPPLRAWHDSGAIAWPAKLMAVGSLTLTLGVSIYIVPFWWTRLFLLALGASVAYYILSRPSRAPA